MLHLKRHNSSSADKSVEYVEKHFPWARIVKNRRNVGYAKGCNIGARSARGEIIAWNIMNIRDTMTERRKVQRTRVNSDKFIKAKEQDLFYQKFLKIRKRKRFLSADG